MPCCLFLLPNLLLVPGTKILRNIENSAAPRRIIRGQPAIGTKKKGQGCSCNHRQKSRASCTWDATSQRLGSRYPRGEYSTVGVRSKQNARKEDRTCMRCVTRSLTSRTYFCRSAEQGCLSVNHEGRVSTPTCECVPPPKLCCASLRPHKTNERPNGTLMGGLVVGKIQICTLTT